VAVGGLVGFHFFGNDPAEKEVAKSSEKKASAISSAATASTSKPAAPAASATIPTAASPIDPVIAPESIPLPPGYKEHIVRFDENWDSIAASNAITVDDLQNANPGIDFNVGRLLRVPPAGNRITSGNSFTAKTSSESKLDARHLPDNTRGNAQIHYAPNLDKGNSLVDDSSTLSPSIAPQNAVTTAGSVKTTSPASANKVASAPATSKAKDTGKTLKASGVDTNRPKATTVSKGGSHTVASGDTIYSIAKARGVSAKQLMKVNGITDAGKLKKGQKLKVPADN
jgi:LysM repeat protein